MPSKQSNPRPGNGTSRTSRAKVILGAGIAATLVLLVTAGPAAAHVTVNPDSATKGSETELTFRAPNEETTAATTELQVKIPIDHPIAQVLARPAPGWTVSVQTVKLAKPITTDDGQFDQAVTEVTWSGGKILPGQYEDFSVSAAPLPTDTTQLVFKAVQTYSNGDVVRWIDVPQAGKPVPEHPAPVLTLTAASGDSPAGGTVKAAVTTSVATRNDGTARTLAVVGLIVGALGLVLGTFGLLRGRRVGQT